MTPGVWPVAVSWSEPMRSAAIDMSCQSAFVVHLFDGGGDLRRRAVRIQRAVADEDRTSGSDRVLPDWRS